ncbi:MAG: OmpA family protein, partial [Bacteroidales bacterium]|nr:OmpA family protein [Bacteroidales bacterium]
APEEDEAIKAICEAMKADNKLQTVITGHTDDRGPEKYNMKCGQRRAEALKRYMVSLGAPDANIKCESKGETQPIADNDTREGRAKNRRATVELKIEN